MAAFVRESAHAGTDPAMLVEMAVRAGIDPGRLELVAGDIRTSASDYARRNPGLRIALLHMDLDLGEPTFAALTALWPRVVAGGIVVFDEYAVPQWSESDGVDRFLAEWPSHQLAPEAREVRCRALRQLGREAECTTTP